MAAARRTVLLLPACTFPDVNTLPHRETELQRNISALLGHWPGAHVIVCDNGVKPPTVKGAGLVHDSTAFTDDPSIGECRNLLNGLSQVQDHEFVIKLHARCRLTNIGDMEKFLSSSAGFFLVTPNLWKGSARGYDAMPYVDTRVFASNAHFMRRILTDTLTTLMEQGGRFEQALLSVIMRSPTDAELLCRRGSFFPVMDGRSGHGRDYSSPAAKVRSRLKSILFKIGL